jgi:hypothetical protein
MSMTPTLKIPLLHPELKSVRNKTYENYLYQLVDTIDAHLFPLRTKAYLRKLSRNVPVSLLIREVLKSFLVLGNLRFFMNGLTNTNDEIRESSKNEYSLIPIY